MFEAWEVPKYSGINAVSYDIYIYMKLKVKVCQWLKLVLLLNQIIQNV